MTREEAIEFLKRMKWQADYVEMGDDEGDEALDMAIEALKQPEIIRCEDCYCWTNKCEDNWHYCAYLDSYHKADFYCAVGRRREE